MEVLVFIENTRGTLNCDRKLKMNGNLLKIDILFRYHPEITFSLRRLLLLHQAMNVNKKHSQHVFLGILPIGGWFLGTHQFREKIRNCRRLETR